MIDRAGWQHHDGLFPSPVSLQSWLRVVRTGHVPTETLYSGPPEACYGAMEGKRSAIVSLRPTKKVNQPKSTEIAPLLCSAHLVIFLEFFLVVTYSWCAVSSQPISKCNCFQLIVLHFAKNNSRFFV